MKTKKFLKKISGITAMAASAAALPAGNVFAADASAPAAALAGDENHISAWIVILIVVVVIIIILVVLMIVRKKQSSKPQPAQENDVISADEGAVPAEDFSETEDAAPAEDFSETEGAAPAEDLSETNDGE